MAGNGDGDNIRCTSLPNSVRFFRCADTFGDLRIARRRAGRDFPQRLPDALLESRPPHIERQIETQRRCLDKTGDLGRHALDRKSTRLNSSHLGISYAVFCLKKKKKKNTNIKTKTSD